MTTFANNPSLPRGLRDNNPGNIRPSTKYKWDGQVGSENNYCVFIDVEHGIRAMAKDLMAKIGRGLNTIAKYVPVYAPPSDNNNTQGYINRVCAATGFAPDEVLQVNTYTIGKLVKAHISVEVGDHYAGYITDMMIQVGVKLAVE